MMKRTILMCCIAVVVFLGCRKEYETVLDRSRVQRGTFLATLTETGELQALRSKVVVSPNHDYRYGDMKIVDLEKEGTIVDQGDWVGQVDTTGVIKYILDQKNSLAIEEANLQKMVVEQEIELRRLESELKVQEAQLRQAVIDTQRSRFEAKSQREIYALRYKIANVSFEKVKRNIEHTKVIQRENLLIQKNKLRRIQGNIDKANRLKNGYYLRAPGDGMVVYKRVGWGRRRNKIKVGDEIHRGWALIGLPDMSEMKAESAVNETDIGKISIGQKVRVRLDAFPKEVFEGELMAISKICQDKDEDSDVKVFDIEVLLHSVKPICRPGMTVSCEIILAEYEDALFVDNSFVFEKDGDYYITVQRDGGTVDVVVELGPRNSESVVVTGDVKAGEKLMEPNVEEHV